MFQFQEPKKRLQVALPLFLCLKPQQNVQTPSPARNPQPFFFPRWNRVFSSHPMWRGVAATARCCKLSPCSTLSQLRHFSREPADGTQGVVRTLKNAAGLSNPGSYVVVGFHNKLNGGHFSEILLVEMKCLLGHSSIFWDVTSLRVYLDRSKWLGTC